MRWRDLWDLSKGSTRPKLFGIRLYLHFSLCWYLHVVQNNVGKVPGAFSVAKAEAPSSTSRHCILNLLHDGSRNKQPSLHLRISLRKQYNYYISKSQSISTHPLNICATKWESIKFLYCTKVWSFLEERHFCGHLTGKVKKRFLWNLIFTGRKTNKWWQLRLTWKPFLQKWIQWAYHSKENNWDHYGHCQHLTNVYLLQWAWLLPTLRLFWWDQSYNNKCEFCYLLKCVNI